MGVRSRTGKSTKAAAKTKAAAQATNAKPAPAPKSLWNKVADKDVELAPEEALKAAHWIRQAMGIVMGVLYGIVRLTGAPAIMSYLLVAALAPPALLSLSNELDPEEIAKVAPIQLEGMMPSVALFLLCWILSYTVFLPPNP